MAAHQGTDRVSLGCGCAGFEPGTAAFESGQFPLSYLSSNVSEIFFSYNYLYLLVFSLMFHDIWFVFA
jgi:hypothetical protein